MKTGSRFIDRTGMRLGRLTVVRCVGRNRNKQSVWECKCECGNVTNVIGALLKEGGTRSCGCLTPDSTAQRNASHGLTYSQEYRVWAGMVQRCKNPRNKSYKNYGGRGIEVCERWMNFENFIKDMGSRPDGLTIERVNVSLGYSPGNVVWASKKDQCNNKRTSRILTHNGRSMTLNQWASEVGVNRTLIRDRIRLGWKVSDAIEKPARKMRK